MTKKERLIYLAGIADGEGHFALQKVKNGKGYVSYQPRIVIVNTDGPLVKWIQKHFGGYVYTYPTGSDTRRECKPLHRWQIVGKKAVGLAAELQPYLIVKKQQVKRIVHQSG